MNEPKDIGYKNSIKVVCLCIFLYFDKIVSLLDRKVSLNLLLLLYLCINKNQLKYDSKNNI